MQYSLARTEQGQTLGITAKMANRHGLIAGATGTGKTVTLRKMAEAFSDDGVPVFLVDVKGDLSGLVKAGTFSGKVAILCHFGMYSVKPVFRFAPRFLKWDHYYFPVY